MEQKRGREKPLHPKRDGLNFPFLEKGKGKTKRNRLSNLYSNEEDCKSSVEGKRNRLLKGSVLHSLPWLQGRVALLFITHQRKGRE